MLYLAIDQHAKQLTVCVRDEEGGTVLRRQVSTRPEKIAAVFEQLLEMDTEFMAILECCGFNDWLIDELRKRACREIVLIHPEKPSKKKTDRRDARKLCDLLWTNRERLAEGKTVHGLRRVYIATQQEKDDRQITAVRQSLGQRLNRVTNKIQRILHRHNLMWSYPTKCFQTKTGKAWLKTVQLPEVDRLEMDLLLQEWTSLHEQIKRFPRPRSLANYFGLTPGCRNSGNNAHRPGSITKEGSRFVRFVLGQLVLHFLKHDPKMRDWYRKIKLRRGAKIARVAVMRRITTIFWHMLTYEEAYCVGGPPPRLRKKQADHQEQQHAA